jgi:hypothetical protein
MYIRAQGEYWTIVPLRLSREGAAGFYACASRLGFLFLLSIIVAAAQTTQGLISGRLLNSVTGGPISGAQILYTSSLSNLEGSAESDESGYYLLPLLSPGLYNVRVTAEGFQAQEIQEIELTVAARIDLDFRLRPLNDVWEAGQYNSVFLPGSKTIVTFYGPDVDSSKTGSFEAEKGRREALESTVSEVIDRSELSRLPLAGRDVYTMLVTQPGVTSDAATSRGLGLSINGQRPTASNFLLDGVENNNYLITGPLTPIAPEAIQEYRVSTNNFTAEYGRTSGFLANAITRTGSNGFHGLGYFYLKNDVLNANGFQENLSGSPRIPDKEIQPGYFVGGPILKNRLFFSSAFEHLRSRSFQDRFTFLLPSTKFFSVFPQTNTTLYNLLSKYPAPAVTDGFNPLAPLTVAPPVSVNRSLGIERIDYTTPSGRDRIMARGIFVKLSRPDFIWNPYKDFVTPLIQDTWAAGGSHIHNFSASTTNEFRLSRSDDDLHFNRPHPEVPTLLALAPLNYFPIGTITLPGSSQFYSYQNHSKTTEFLDNVIRAWGRHLITVGAGLLLRNVSGYLTAGRDGEYMFPGLFNVALDQPSNLLVTLERDNLAGSPTQPNYDREYTYHQYFLFFQDSFRLTPRLTINFGIRYENFGSPQNTGTTKDTLVQLGSGGDLNAQLSGATLVRPARGDEQLFGADNKDVAFRVGASYDLLGNGRTLVRGAFGSFYDRPFDNLWQGARNNNFLLSSIAIRGVFNYLTPIDAAIRTLAKASTPTPFNFPDLTLVAADLLNGRAYSYFAGVQHYITNNFTLEVNTLGTYGRKLITTDVINRDFTVAAGRVNPALGDINYRANQGFSDYNAFTAVARYRWSRGFLQGSYTWSHYIDNQSDPLVGDFFDLSFTAISSGAGSGGRAAFTQQFNPNADKGNSDFDQRHNLVLFSYWNLPGAWQGSKAGVLFRNWTLAGLAAFRSGFPYTVINNASAVIAGSGALLNPRPDLVDPRAAVLSNPIAIPGGKQLLNAGAFAGVSDRLGTAGRNALIGPGLYNIDLSVGRSFAIPLLGESGRLTFRVDAFNFLNHANLNNPDSLLGDTDTFGQALFGRQGRQSGFPAVTPFNETARQIQMLLRIEF